MKTLDEVIKALEVCMADDAIESEGAYLATDALHYLKEYRMMLDDIAEKRQELEDEKARYQEAVKNCETAENRHKAYELGYIRAMADYEELKNFWAESQANPPLTFDELKQMEGKPVWVEWTERWQDAGRWMIVADFDNRCIDMVNAIDGEMRFDRSDLTWQAYRKERQ